MKTFRKAFCLFLVLVLCLGTVPFSVCAATQTDGSWIYNVKNGGAEIVFFDSSVTGDVVIPSELGGYKVTSIGNGAFNNRKSITSVTIPDTVTSIGKEAFKSCALKSISIGKGVTSIGPWAFYYCTSLESVTIPDNVTVIGESAFENCTALTSVSMGKGVTTLGQNAFRTCYKLSELTIGKNVTAIGSGAFYDCKALKSVTLPDSVTGIGSVAFRNCSALESISFGKNVTTIEYSAFSNCTSLKDVYFDGKSKEWKAISIDNGNDALTGANVHILVPDPIIPSIPSTPDTPSDPDQPGSSDNSGNSTEACSCNCHGKGFKKFIFKIALFFQKIFRKNQTCACGSLHYVIL